MQTATSGLKLQSYVVQATGNHQNCNSHHDSAAACKALPGFVMTTRECVHHMVSVLGTLQPGILSKA